MPTASYLFNHALVQDAAYSTLLREPRRALHSRVVESLEAQFPEIAENQPELLARHCAEAGLTEKAAGLWSKAGWRSLERSALTEAAEQITRALVLMASLPGTPASRREQIKLQVALITPLMQVKGHSAPETTAAAERARLLIEEAGALGEPPDDPLLLYSVLYGFWHAANAAFNGDKMRDLAAQFLALAEKRAAIIPLIVGHRLMGSSLTLTGDIAAGRAHYDKAVVLYDPAEHCSLAMPFGQDLGVANLAYRSLALWLLGYPEAAQADNETSIKDARVIGYAATLILALTYTSIVDVLRCANYATAKPTNDELVALADEKGAVFWKTGGTLLRGHLIALAGEAEEGVQIITSSMAALRATGAKMFVPFMLAHLSRAYIEIGHFDNAWRSISEAMTHIKTTKERWLEAEVNRVAGQVALCSPEHDAANAQSYFERALAVARQQQAKSWELRASMSLARLWRDQGKPQQARELLAPVYGWFTEGFDTRDLKDAKALLEELQT